MRAAFVVLLLFVTACPAPTSSSPTSSSPPPSRPPTHTPGPTPTAGGAAGASCTKAEDCDSKICEGQGCGDTPGTCAPAVRGCTRDRRDYCGCDGVTFQASGSCPGKRFSARNACPAK